MQVPGDLLYTTTHEWVRVEGESAVVGITDFAQNQLSDLTFVELPAAGDEFSSSDEVAVVESVKAASDVYAPVSGKILEVNERLEGQPDLLNSDPYGEGWLFKIHLSNQSEQDSLLTAEAYKQSMPAQT
jgi:glycine cleavage system H protein